MSMRERIARAIYAARGWTFRPDEDGDAIYKEVDAALDALMEPTDEMVQAGRGRCMDYEGDNARLAWEAMIEAAKAS